MSNQSYYRILTDIDNNLASDKTFLRVNCTGHSFYSDEVRASSIRQDYYLIYLYSGTVQVKKPVVERQIIPGDLIIFQPECDFDYLKAAGIDMEYYWVHFTGYGAGEILSKCGLETNCILIPGIHECICESFRNLFESFLSRDRFLDVESAQNLAALLVKVGKCISGQIADEPHNYSRISRSISLIHKNIASDLKVSTLATEEHISVSHFRAVFHQVTGLSPKEYITLAKLNYSCELMRQTDLNINEIGAAVGYDDPQYFNRVFKKNFGLSPGVYKERNRNR